MTLHSATRDSFTLADLVSPAEHWRSLRDAARYLYGHRELLYELTAREIKDRYAGQVFGMFWSIAHPLVLVCTYLVIFVFVFQVRFPEGHTMPRDYATYILAGVIPWLTFSEAMNRACVSVVSNRALVKQVVFPIEILPIRSVLAAMVFFAITMVALVLYSLIRFGSIPGTFGLVFVLAFFQILAMSGIGLLLAGLGAYFRDAKDVVQVFSLIGPYLIPAFFLPQWVPTALKPILYANPFSYLVWCFQDACYFGRVEHPIAWIVFPLMSVIVFSVGFMSFRRLKFAFGNFL